MSIKHKISLLIAVLIGVLVSFTNVILTLVLLIVIVILALTSVGLLISSFFLGRRAIITGLIAIVPILATLGTSAAVRGYRQSKAIEIKTQLETYRSKHGQYPNDLLQVTTISIKGLKY